MNNHFKYLIVICSLLLGLLLCSVDCPRKKGPCHDTITVVNNSDSTVTICRIARDVYYNYWLGKVMEIEPQQSTEIRMVPRTGCLEDLSLTDEPAMNHTLWVLPGDYTFIETSTYDSLFIVYDVLKIINLKELGIDYLEKTDFKVYYP